MSMCGVVIGGWRVVGCDWLAFVRGGFRVLFIFVIYICGVLGCWAA
jgi:hypothetical protein